LIIFRYLTKQVVVTMLAITAVLLLVVMSGRFIKYLGEAAADGLSAELIVSVMGYRIPGFLEIILPLGFFLGILMAYGRLYLDSEMTVLSACGISLRRLAVITLIPALIIAGIEAYLSTSLSPWGAREARALFDAQKKSTQFDLLTPGRFQRLGDTGQVAYTEALIDGRSRMHNVLISQHDKNKDDLVLLNAEYGIEHKDEETGSHFLLLENGYRYDGVPGEADYRVTRFEKYAVRLPQPEVVTASYKSELKPTAELLASTRLEDIAQLQWRISMPLLVPIIALIAVPMSRVNPRQGRYMRLVPSVILYMGYVVLLSAASRAVGDGKIPVWLGLWWIHLLFLGIGLALIFDLHHKLPWYHKFASGRR
jgi:lipopolysaccharide export system permease protein